MSPKEFPNPSSSPPIFWRGLLSGNPLKEYRPGSFHKGDDRSHPPRVKDPTAPLQEIGETPVKASGGGSKELPPCPADDSRQDPSAVVQVNLMGASPRSVPASAGGHEGNVGMWALSRLPVGAEVHLSSVLLGPTDPGLRNEPQNLCCKQIPPEIIGDK